MAKKEQPATQFAVITSGGKQYRVSPGQVIRVELLEGGNGETIEFKEVGLVSTSPEAEPKIGSPTVKGASVKGKILSMVKDRKVVSFYKRRRKGFTKKIGHRQKKTAVMIESISAGS